MLSLFRYECKIMLKLVVRGMPQAPIPMLQADNMARRLICQDLAHWLKTSAGMGLQK